MTLTNVVKRFGETPVLSDLSLSVADGEFVVLLGPSGCGKSTVLRLIAGLDDVNAGSITIGDRDVGALKPNERDIAMLFQNYALYPHMSVRDNIEFPLKCAKMPRADRAERVAEAADALGVGMMLDRRPAQLSGGQRQRVALARALVRRPSVFLLDEPLSNLDAKLRVQTREKIAQLHRELGTTTIYVTHDQVEAMTMADRIGIIDQGCIQQIGEPQTVYDRPDSTFVARFIGDPPMNCVPATARHEPGRGLVIELAGGVVVLGDAEGAGAPATADARAVTFGVRPEHLVRDPEGPIASTLASVELLGAEQRLFCRLADDSMVVLREPTAPRPAMGSEVRLRVDPADVHLFDGETGRRIDR